MAFAKVLSVTLLMTQVFCIELPETCKYGQYYDPDKLSCERCSVNSSLVASEDGFSCVCDSLSILKDMYECHKCNPTEVPTPDKTACVPRRCQKDKSGRLACRRCPTGYISVLQNFDGSPMREVQCMKCAKGYRAVGERCERCMHCSCLRNETLVKDVCVSKEFISNRPKPENGRFHPNTMMEIIRNEYTCLKGDVRACRNLTDQCVKSLYSSDQGGPCRLWIKDKPPPGLAQLAFDPSKTGQRDYSEQINLSKGHKYLLLVSTVYTAGGGIRFLRNNDKSSECLLPMNVHVGSDFKSECSIPIDHLLMFSGESLAAYADVRGSFHPVPITIKKPTGKYVQGLVVMCNKYGMFPCSRQKENWPTDRFNRYYLINRFSNPLSNLTSTIYLQTLIVHVRIKREEIGDGLRIKISLEAQYSWHSDREKTVMTYLRVKSDLPQAGILRILEIWGSVLGAVAVLYAAFMWRGTTHRGGQQWAVGPLLAGSLADALFMAAWCTTLHALAAEILNTGLPLPLSETEETTIEAFALSALALKIVYVLWFNWCQSRVDVFLLDWSEYDSATRDGGAAEIKGQSGAVWVIREFSALQAVRRASPAYTVPLTLLILRLSLHVQHSLPRSPAYFWAFCVSIWLSAYLCILTIRWMKDRVLGSPISKLLTACRKTGTSLIVFKEEFYAHYVHGRSDVISDTRTFIGPLAAGRVLCVPQLRSIYTQLSTPIAGNLNDNEARRVLLSKFLASFFERALDGLTWIAVERTLLERLFDVELSSRESGNTSAILYDPENLTPSICNSTWWGEEWSLASLDVFIFGCIVLSSGDTLMAGFVCLCMWQILRWLRILTGNLNIKKKIAVELLF